MNRIEKVKEWIKRAESNFARAEAGKVRPEILYEDLCFDLQQSVEKILKAICIFNDIHFPRTHSIDYLIDLLEDKGIDISEEIQKAKILTEYAVETRYPGDYEAVDEIEYLSALEVSRKVLKWGLKILNL